MKRIYLLFFHIFIILFIGVKSYPVELYVTGNRLSVHANNEHLGDILQLLANQGITVHADPEINPLVTVDFNNREMEKGLNDLFRNINYILLWKSIDTPLGQFVRLNEVHLFRPGKKELTKILAPNTRKIARNPKDGSLFIKNQILIRLSSKIDLTDFKKYLDDNDLAVSGYNRFARILIITLPDNSDYFAILELISRYPGIKKAEPNYAYPIDHPLFLSTSPSNTFKNRTFAGSENTVPVAVIDSGLTGDYQSAPYIYAYFNSIDPDESVSDTLGHGTQMAMIAGGAVRPVGTGDSVDSLNPVIAIKGFDENGYISNFDLLNGIEFAVNNGARVLSLSWGSETKSEFLEQTFDYAASKGLIVLAAAGNEPTGNDMYPAAYNSVIGVGALDPQGKKWDKSNYGDFVKIYAPGFASFPVGYNGGPGTYAGTSISTAFVANEVAAYLSKNPGASIKEILAALSDRKN